MVQNISKLLIRRHISVKTTDTAQGAFDPKIFQADTFDVGELIVRLDGAAAGHYGQSVSVIRLAGELLDFWHREFINRK